MAAINSVDEASPSNDDNRIRQLIHEYVQRRTRGETVSEQSLMDRHPELRADLEEALKGLRVANSAFDQAAQETSGLQLRCPHCHTPLTLSDDAQLKDLSCYSCGNAVALIQQTLETGMFIGNFELLQEVGAGSFGTVWRARDTELDRLVAIKVPRSSCLTAEETEQFIREAKTVAQLRHPQIVNVHRVESDGNRVCLVTDLVEGPSLTEIAKNGLTWHESVCLCASIADALDHAHQHGVIHRDLKPSNIVLDSRGKPCLMDFGLAKRDAAEVTMTMEGKLVGTPAYMSPEQARGTAHDADARSDVYSLGVILYELLTGERPFRGTTRMLIHQTLLEDVPPLRRFNASVPKDVETICLKCLEKHPDRRYQTASDLAIELRRVLSGKPVQARPISAAAKTWRWCRRNPLPASLVATIMATVFVALCGITWAFVQSQSARQMAVYEADQQRRQRYLSDMTRIYAAWQENDVQLCVELLDRYQPRVGQNDLRRFEWYLLWNLCKPALTAPRFKASLPTSVTYTPDGKLVVAGMQGLHIFDPASPERRRTIPSPHTFPVGALAFRPPDYRMFATASLDEILELWTLDELDRPQVLYKPQRASQSDYFYGVSFSSDGSLLATNHPKKKSFLVWKVATLESNEFQVLGRNGMPQRVREVAFTPSLKSHELALACSDGVVRLWNYETRSQRALWEHDRAVFALAFSPDGNKLATTGRFDNAIKVGNLDTGDFGVLMGNRERVMRLAFSPDGKFLATAGEDSLIRIWSLEEKRIWRTIKGHSGLVAAVAFSPNGKTLASAAWDGDVCMWDLSTDVLRDRFPGSVAQFSSDSTMVVTSTDWGDTKVWSSATGKPANVSLPRDSDMPQAVSPDLRLLAKALPDGAISIVDLQSADSRTLDGHNTEAEYLWFSLMGDVVASMADGELKFWDVARLRLLSCCELFKGADTPRGRFLFAIDDQGKTAAFLRKANPGVYELEVRDVRNDKLVGIYELNIVPTSLAFSSNGMFLATGHLDGTLNIWESRTRRLVTGPVHAHPNRVNALAISPDGTRIATGGRDDTVKIWELTSGEHILSVRGSGKAMIKSLNFSPDGTMLAAGGDDNLVRLLRAPLSSE